MKQVVWVIIVVGVVVGAVVIGGGLGEAATTRATPMTFWTFGPGASTPFFEAAARAWNAAYPERPIALTCQLYPYEDLHTRLLIALKTGQGAPDLSDIEVNKFPNFVRKGDQIHLIPLNDLIEPVQAKFVQARFAIYAKDGQYYGVDYHVGATVMFYNQEILAQAGVDVNKIETWADFVNVGKRVVAKTGKMMTTIETLDTWTQWPLISQRGSDFLDQDGNPTLDDAVNISALQFQYDLIYKERIAIVAPGGLHLGDQYWAFMKQGGAAAVMMPIWFMNCFVTSMPALKGKMLIRPLPRWEAGGFRSAGMGGTATVITDQCHDVALAKAFLAYAKLTQAAAINIWNQIGIDPIRWDAWPLLKEQPPNKYTEYFGTEIFDILMQVKDEIHPVHYGELSPKIKDLYRSKIVYHVLELKDQTPAEALHAAAAELRRLQK